MWRGLLMGLLAYVALRPLLGLGHELVVAAVAGALHQAVASNGWVSILDRLPLDPVYTGGAIRAAGGVIVQGVAVGGVLGDVLRAWTPGFFLGPDLLAAGAGASMVAAPGAPAIGRALAAVAGDAFWLATGLLLWLHFRHRHVSVATVGVLLQAQVLFHHLATTSFSIVDLESSGLPFALAVLSPNREAWFTQQLAALDPLLQQVFGAAIGVITGVACALLLVGLTHLLGAALRKASGGRWEHPPRRALVPFSAASLVALATVLSPVGALATGSSNWQMAKVHTLRKARLLAGDSTASLSAPRRLGPIPVSLHPLASGGWEYLVDGQPQVIRGVGYNPQYAALDVVQRERLYDRDFGAMKSLGINTIEGWFEGQFDDITLAAAARHGIGVLMPFEINQDVDLSDPAVQQAVLDRAAAWVARYRNNPAVRMWAPGNENVHRILYPHWVSKTDDPGARARAEAFGRFLPRLVDRIHAADAFHPVVYRDAEDVYLPWILPAFKQAGGTRPWLMYGTNVYATSRMKQIIDTWPSQWLGGPLLISEFAPGGVGGDARSAGFQEQWDVIRSRPNWVIGGLAYTWATNGPEKLDKVFGLVAADGVPTDGALAALSTAFHTRYR